MLPTGTRDISSLDELSAFARELIGQLPPRCVVLLFGPLGVGKTELVRAVVAALGSDETVSPSFAIHNRYETPARSVDHLDLYRLESEDDLESTGFWDLFAPSEGLILIEWPERLPENALPLTWPRLEIRLAFKDNRRAITWKLPP